MRMRCTIQFEFEVSDDPDERAEAYPAGSTPDQIAAAEARWIAQDPGYLGHFDEPVDITIEPVCEVPA